MSTENASNQQLEDAIHPVSPEDIEMTAKAAAKDLDPFLVTFEEPFDAENPKYADSETLPYS